MRLRSNMLNKITVLAVAAAVLGCGGQKTAEQVGQVAEVESTVKRVSLVFGGDVMQHMPQIASAKTGTGYDYTETFRYLAPFFDTADLVVLNLETTLSANDRYSGYPMFSSPPELASALREAGVDVLTLANNHSMDKGRRGTVATVRILDSLGIRHTGVFTDSAQYRKNNPLHLDVKGFRIALLNYTYGLNGLPVPDTTVVNLIDTTRIAGDIFRAREGGAEQVIAYFHWGNEYERRANRHQRELAAWCYAKGVDFVIGAHPHVIQPVESHTDSVSGMRRMTAYSLGNLVSNQRKRYTDGGMILRLDIEQRDSLPPTVDASYMLTWVWTPTEGGRRKYVILPSPVADTLLERYPAAKPAYDVFLSDSRKLQTDTTITEIRYRTPRHVTDSLLRTIGKSPASVRPEELFPIDGN